MKAAKKSALFGFIILCKMLCVANQAQSNPVDTVRVSESTSSLEFHSEVLFFIDREGVFDLSKVRSEQLNDSLQNQYIPGVYQGGDLWTGFYVKNESVQKLEYIFEVGAYGEVHVFYRKIRDPDFQEKVTGRYIPFPENELGDNHFRINKVKVELDAGESYEFKVFYPDPGIDLIKPEFIISSQESWLFNQAAKDAKGNILLGLFFGVAIVLAFINFIYFFIHEEKAYLRYSTYIFMLIYFEASRYGIIDASPLIQYPVLYFVLENTFLVLILVYYLLFLRSFINTKERYPLWDKTVTVLIIILFGGLSVCLWMIAISRQPLTAIEIRNYFMLATLPVTVFFLVNLGIRGNRIDKIFILGSIALIGSGMASILLDLFVKENKYPDLIFQVGVIVELTIFSIGLGLKSRTHEKEKLQAQQNLIGQLRENERLQLSINQELESQVNERTKEIQAQNEELTTQQEELAAHRDMLEGQNKTIAKSMAELQEIKLQLEDKVEKRTLQLKNTNHELLQRNNQLEQYAYITAHNLRGPVARLKGLMYIFEQIGAVSKDNKEVVEKITNSALEMDDVLTDMNAILEIKNKNYGQTQKIDIKAAIEKVIKILSDNLDESQAEVKLKLDISHIHTNEPYLESIFYNLIGNALKYRCETRKLKIVISAYQNDKNVVFEVSDNGLGLDLEKFGGKIFGLYQRFHDHVGGKGMGLFLVKSQIEALGGTIDISSKVNKGTTFKIIFPM